MPPLSANAILPLVGEITPLMLNAFMWLAFCAAWTIAAFFAHRTRIAESRWNRLLHVVPLYLGGLLIFYHRHRFIAPGRLYRNNAIAHLGNVITFAGILFAAWARIALGRYWSGLVTLKHDHKLIRTGPYRFVRHPIYTGMIIALIGSALTAATIDAWLGVAIATTSLVFKLLREEALLGREFGEEYRRFKEEVPALAPLIY